MPNWTAGCKSYWIRTYWANNSTKGGLTTLDRDYLNKKQNENKAVTLY